MSERAYSTCHPAVSGGPGDSLHLHGLPKLLSQHEAHCRAAKSQNIPRVKKSTSHKVFLILCFSNFSINYYIKNVTSYKCIKKYLIIAFNFISPRVKIWYN
jgi:hypothetical protein